MRRTCSLCNRPCEEFANHLTVGTGGAGSMYRNVKETESTVGDIHETDARRGCKTRMQDEDAKRGCKTRMQNEDAKRGCKERMQNEDARRG